MDDKEIRLRLVEVLAPQATRLGMMEPEIIVKTCQALENYVLDLKIGAKLPDAPPVSKTSRSKRTTDDVTSGTQMTLPFGG